jgi:ubiquinone biosynthesis protein
LGLAPAGGAALDDGNLADLARRAREAMEVLGPTFVKFGQLLSVRQDLFPPAVILEFTRLQESVPPFPADEARRIVEEELGVPVDSAFAAFEDAPLAAASIAQVHAARLQDGTRAIVKVQRPGIHDIVEMDLEILFFIARLISERVPGSKRFDLVPLVEEFAESIRRELDFRLEASSMERFRENFRDDAAVYVPGVFKALSGQRVLTMEHSPGVRVIDAMAGDVTQRQRLARELLRVFLTQIFDHGFFHADPHPGNLFVLPDGRLCFHDFGIVGRLAPTDRENFRQFFLALILRDPAWMADAYLDMGGAGDEDVDRDAFARDLGASLERFYSQPPGKSSFAGILEEFLQLSRHHRIRALREMALAAKAFMTVESVILALDPSTDMPSAMRAQLPHILLGAVLPGAGAQADLASSARLLSRLRMVLVRLPDVLARLSAGLRGGRALLRIRHENLEPLQEHIDRASNRLSLSLIIAAVVVGSSIVMSFHSGPHLRGIPLVGLIGYVVAGVLGLWWAVAILRSGRL